MKVKMNVSITGRRHDGRAWPSAGEEVTVPDWEGAELCAQGYAEPVAEAPEKRAEKRPSGKKSEKRSK